MGEATNDMVEGQDASDHSALMGTHETDCSQNADHHAHMAVNGSCPWCGAYDESQTEFMTVDEAVEVFG